MSLSFSCVQGLRELWLTKPGGVFWGYFCLCPCARSGLWVCGRVFVWSSSGLMSCLAGVVRAAVLPFPAQSPSSEAAVVLLLPRCWSSLRLRRSTWHCTQTGALETTYKYLFSGNLFALLGVNLAVTFSWVFPFCYHWQGKGNGERISVVDLKKSITLLKGRTWNRLGRLFFSQYWKSIHWH